MRIDMHKKYTKNGDVIVRKIEGEYLMVPISAGIGDMEDEMYTLNETGIAVWEKLSPEKTLETVVAELYREYDVDKDTLKEDVIGLMAELFKRNIVVCC